jgi:hypothetical protein
VVKWRLGLLCGSRHHNLPTRHCRRWGILLACPSVLIGFYPESVGGVNLYRNFVCFSCGATKSLLELIPMFFCSCRISHIMTYYSCVFPIDVILKSFEGLFDSKDLQKNLVRFLPIVFYIEPV